MSKESKFSNQFHLEQRYYLKQLDLVDWYRYYFIIQEVIDFKPTHILEIGAGSGMVKNCLQPMVKQYTVMDINPKLKPDILSDLREFKPELKGKFNCVICAEVLEHMPFDNFEKNLTNIYDYLAEDGKVLITLPQRRARLMIITPLSYQKPLVITLPSWLKSGPKSFYKQFIKRKIWIDPYHCWEIGDGKVKRRDVERLFKKVGFKVDKFKKLLHADFWTLNKHYGL